MLIFILNHMKILWIPGFWKNLVKRQDFCNILYVVFWWFFLFLFRIGTIVEVHSGPLAAQTEDLETISTGEVKNSSVDLVEGALTLTGIKSIKIVVVNQKLSFTQGQKSILSKNWIFLKVIIFCIFILFKTSPGFFSIFSWIFPGFFRILKLKSWFFARKSNKWVGRKMEICLSVSAFFSIIVFSFKWC